jgi:diadenosine tetraphosphate (Ap4A) HIT family hydrolase
MFMLHPQLAADTVVLGDLSVCRVLLNVQFRQYPWLILVPRRTGCRDLTDVPPMDFGTMMDEVAAVHDAVRSHTKAPKMNVGALGNMVPQLHIHIIARDPADPAWPKPVWGHDSAKPDADGGVARAALYKKVLVDAGIRLEEPILIN